MTETTVAWFHSLTESVAGLGSAAREYRTAAQAVRIASWHLDPVRLLPADGSVRVIGSDRLRPHDDAVTQLGALYGDLGYRVRKLYENAALAYAYGTATVLAAVLAGDEPAHVALGRRDGRYVLPRGPLPDFREPLTAWKDNESLAARREDLVERENAAAIADEFAHYADLADYDVSDLTAASKLAAGLADTACAYGELAESALHFVLLNADGQRHDRGLKRLP